METLDKIYREIHFLIATTMRATAYFHETQSGDAAKAVVRSQNRLPPLLREAAKLRDIYLLLRIERAFMELELEHVAYDEDHISSLDKGIWQVGTAITMLDYARAPDEYHPVDFFYTLSQDLVPNSDLPKDAAHKFFGSHSARLGNRKKAPLQRSEAALINARISNMRLARKIYVEWQRQALAASEVREPSVPYAPERKLKLVA